MALSPDELDQVTRSTVDLYRAAEEAVLTRVTRRLAAGMDAADWQAQRLGQLGSLRRSVQRILDATADQSGEHIRAAVAESWRTGTGRATVGIPARLLPADPDAAAGAVSRPPTRVDVVESLAGELVSDINRKHANVLRHVEDVYRGTIQQAAAVSAAGGLTRRQAAQHAYRQFIDQGVTGFTDVSGRQWRLSSYAEMATRTVTQRAAVQGQTDRLLDLGQDLVIISDSPRECERCRPWEGTVLSISGATPTGTVEMEHAAEDTTVEVRVDGTLDEARSAGLFHPNCTHSARSYLPGVTRRQPATANPEGDRAQQRQRQIERQIRKWKERGLGALDPAAAASARNKVRAWQREMRDHLGRNPELKRLRYREQIGGGNIPSSARGISRAPAPQPTLGTPTLPIPEAPRVPFAARAAAAVQGEAAVNLPRVSLVRPPADVLEHIRNQHQTDSLRQYKGTAYTNVNEALRRERGAPETIRSVYPQIDDIDAAMDRSPLTEDVLLHRGVHNPREVFGDAWDQDLSGAEWTEHAYMSTTADPAFADQFARDGVVMRVLAPSGTKGVQLSGAEYESELLLERGLRVRVVADSGPGTVPRRLDVEVIAP